ncbi:MAG: hypothetical protein GEU99_25390 [Luteitalea sp.]|nr:hypothetical protein [Luteitalea sp.]
MKKLRAGPGDPLYQFGSFLADPVVGRLYYGDDEVPLTPKSLKVLMTLVEHRGQRVDKDELLQLVWPDTFVEPNNLARNISMIRKALHECDGDQEYIITVPNRGYRLAPTVRQIPRAEFAVSTAISPPAEEESDLNAPAVREPKPEMGPAPVQQIQAAVAGRATDVAEHWRIAWGTFAAAAGFILILGAVAAFLSGSREQADLAPARRLWQLTAAGHLKAEPSWAPDGQLVAYSADRNGNFDIWVQPISGGSPIRVTNGAARDWQPAWSPNGRYLAFRSERDGGGLFVVPAFGGIERRISDFGHAPQWAPDGSRMLFRGPLGVYLVGLDGSGPSLVRSNVLSNQIGRFQVAWHPDGRRISVYGNDRQHGWSLWTVNVEGGNGIQSRTAPAVARRVKEVGLTLGQFVWAPAGDALYFEGRSDYTENLWRVRVNPRTLEWVGGPDRLTTGSSLDRAPAISPDGKRLAFGSHVERTAAWSLPFDPISGRILGEGEPVTPEGANAEILDMSPDGRQLVYRVNARGRQELWIRSVDVGADRLRTVEAGAAIIQPRWSRDGTHLAYLRRPADAMRAAAVVLLAAEDGGQERVLAASRSPEMVYDWSEDGRSFLVRCRANSVQSAICSLANSAGSDRAPDMRVIAADARRNLYAAKRSPDERWVSFIAAPDRTQSTVFVSPAEGGPWTAITEDRYFEDKPRWSPDGRTLYFLSNRTGFFNVWGRRFDPQRGKPVGEPFQVSQFDSSVQMVRNDVSNLQIAVTRDRLILPITQTLGAIWVLENVDQ